MTQQQTIPHPYRKSPPKIGQFFSLAEGRVGQYLSPRVLLVRKPFRRQVVERCYFGFNSLGHARRFAATIAHTGCYFRLDKSGMMPQRYEIEIFNPGEIARILAFWDRQNQLIEDDLANDSINDSTIGLASLAA